MVSRPVRPEGAHDQILIFFLWQLLTFFLRVGRPLWREDGPVICSAITHWLQSRRTHNHISLSHLRVPQPGGPGPRIYIRQEQGVPVIPQGTEFPFRLLLLLAGLRRKYFNPHPHGANKSVVTLVLKLKLKLNYDRQSVGQSVLVSGSHLEPMGAHDQIFVFCLPVAGLLWDALSGERMDL
jgi:hypothetical protein